MNLAELPIDVLNNVAYFLPPRSLGRLRRTCQVMCNLDANDPGRIVVCREYGKPQDHVARWIALYIMCGFARHIDTWACCYAPTGFVRPLSVGIGILTHEGSIFTCPYDAMDLNHKSVIRMAILWNAHKGRTWFIADLPIDIDRTMKSLTPIDPCIMMNAWKCSTSSYVRLAEALVSKMVALKQICEYVDVDMFREIITHPQIAEVIKIDLLKSGASTIDLCKHIATKSRPDHLICLLGCYPAVAVMMAKR